MTEPRRPATGRSAGDFPDVWRVPPRNKNFTGREGLLSRLRSGIVGQPTAVVPHALHGLGGVGKTQMAIEYAYRYRDEYDLVWWIPADQPGLVRSTLAQLASKLGVPGPTTTGIDDAAAAVLEALRRGQPYRRWLLIFDNADEPEDLADIVPPGPGHVLITSRNHRWESVVDTVAVDVFPREESIQFFRRRMARRAIDDRLADRLAEALGDLPLALEQAAALQTETGMTPEDYLKLLNERTGRLLSEGKPSEYPLSMTAAWGLSVSKLKENLPEAMELLRTCAFFGPEPIPRAVFYPVEGPLRPVIAELLADPIRLSRAIARLGKYALVRIEAESGERTLQVHRLIQALLREELDRATQEEIRSEVHTLLIGAAPQPPDEPANWPRYDALLGHVGSARVAESTREDVRDFAIDILSYLRTSGNHRATRSLVDTFVSRWTAASGPGNLHVLRAQRIKGNLLRDLGEYQNAYELDQETLRTLRAAAGDRHPDTLIQLNGIGADLRAQGLFREAREHDEESVRLHRDVLGPTHVYTLRAVNNLALDYGLTSDYRGSRALLEEALRAAQAAGAAAGRGTVLNLWTGLGRAVRLCGDYQEACDVGEDALAYGREHLDADHPRILLAMKDQAIALLRSGEGADALELARDVHARYYRLYGLDNPGTLAAATCLANCLRANGEIEEAFSLASDTMDRYPGMYGPDHPYNYGCASNVALLHRVRGNPQAARELNERALEGIERRLGRDHHYALLVAVNLATDLVELGDLKAACKLGQDTYQRLRHLLGERHPTTLAAAANLAADLETSGQREEAEALFAETRAIYEETLGAEHPDAVVAEEHRHLDCDFDPPPI
ncbi:FxSxx-COOH system tetratricopeptide repeat protein [Actinomadura sp. ATCC 31491]|uniref:FxSxx-COOH system tetratricopeptide repeat protein n=1 Tax=Actinomadura luzonensis TaxID=2805427 RepID=A0ABT0FZZ1_9ACTN|nr:FxSxx-COOH system tetratricopeptide repeat protein [Actinomadura luzonensis]MCK2217844.1 FxSxx-COOH system tetratricopeptide repeat protein [Actinomadura luzonensis]